MITKGMRPIHPGEILLEEFMKPSHPPLNANTLARALEVPPNRITAIIKGQRGSPSTRQCVSQPFSTGPLSFWSTRRKPMSYGLLSGLYRAE